MGQSSYSDTSGGVKAIVSSLTGLFNVGAPAAVVESSESTAAITPEALLQGIKGDYERAYLWTGRIDDTLYCEECTFTDPTLSFKGLSTFKRNVASLRPLVIKLVP
eukprot:9428-Heterococcus_DN1.PRE.1